MAVKKGDRPTTRKKHAEPTEGSLDWVIWAAWADRISFEEIRERSGLRESEVIRVMRRELSPRSFRLWRKRVSHRKTKHRRQFQQSRKAILGAMDGVFRDSETG